VKEFAMKYKTILFDFDGTIADTLPVCFYAFHKVFAKYDERNVSDIEILSMFGPSEVGIIEKNLINQRFVKEAIEDYYIYYDSGHEVRVKKNHEILRMLKMIDGNGIRIGIVTGKARRSYEISVRHLFPDNHFGVAVTGSDVSEAKPHPEGIIKAMLALNSTNTETLYVGDSNADIEAGVRAQVRTVGVNWLENSHGSRFQIKPDYEYNNISSFVEEIIRD
jgi:pyrophosphatase PpaX